MIFNQRRRRITRSGALALAMLVCDVNMMFAATQKPAPKKLESKPGAKPESKSPSKPKSKESTTTKPAAKSVVPKPAVKTAAAKPDNSKAAVGKSAAAESVAKRKWMPAILSREQFDVMARTFNPDLLNPLPHVLFVVDRQQRNKIYYVNMRFYNLHEVFVNSMYLSLERGRTFWENNHLKDNRRFICGRVVYQAPIKRFCFEFWEGDTITSAQLAETSAAINKTFFQSVAFKPNSVMQEQRAADAAGVESIRAAELKREIAYQPLNVARGLGRLRIVQTINPDAEYASDEILVLNETPISLPPVAGIVQAQMATPLSHVNLLARSWGVPNAFIRDADTRFAALDGEMVTYETTPGGFEIKPADAVALAAHARARTARRAKMEPRADLSVRVLAPLTEQRAASVTAYGAKSANLGEMTHARLGGARIPAGWTIPFAHYAEFLRDNKIDLFLRTALRDERFRKDTAHRRERLTQIRELVKRGTLSRELRRDLLERFTAEQRTRGVFVRSSSNTEDLPNFNGAGLYDSVPNVREHIALIDAIKTVWASLWKYEAFETRERAGVDHLKTMMAVLVQEGVNAESSGVMITVDPFNDANRDSVYINAKRGLGMRVVEGKRVAEQILYHPRTRRVDVLTRSAEDSLLEFDEAGGVRESPIKGTRVVLTDDVVRRLAFTASAIKRHFGGADQDIEWAIMGDELFIVQSRPYITQDAVLTRKQ